MLTPALAFCKLKTSIVVCSTVERSSWITLFCLVQRIPETTPSRTELFFFKDEDGVEYWRYDKTQLGAPQGGLKCVDARGEMSPAPNNESST